MPLSSGEVNDAVDALRSALDDGLPDGTTAWITGPAGFTADLVHGFLGIDGLLLGVALLAVFGQRYVALSGNAHRTDLLSARLEKLRKSDVESA